MTIQRRRIRSMQPLQNGRGSDTCPAAAEGTSLSFGVDVCYSTCKRRVWKSKLCQIVEQTRPHTLNRTSSKQSCFIKQAVSLEVLAFKSSSASTMSYYWSRKEIENYAASTRPYIRGHCDEICDHLLMLTEAYKPPMVKTGDLESKFPGYARAAREASDIFEAWFDEPDYT